MRMLKGYSYLIAFAVFFACTIFIRPIFPIDETRYLTVAWEMFISGNHTLLSLNFDPYHHKPPMLFWLINICWNIFGVSRWAAQIPVFIGSALVLVLSEKLAKKIYVDHKLEKVFLVPWLMLGALPFLIYSTMVMFDLMLTAAVLASLLAFLNYAERPNVKTILLAGIIMGCGVLIKGPVAYLYILWPLALFPIWKSKSQVVTNAKFYKAIGGSVLISAFPILLWLVPALLQADQNFAYWILWEQTAGRVHGDFGSSHVRPFYFFLMLAPIMIMPWCFTPNFWKGIKNVSSNDKATRFLMCAFLPVFISFSLIAGKQPHYLVPLLPYIAILLSQILTSEKLVKNITLVLIALFIVGQTSLHSFLLYKYDLTPMAAFYQNNKDHDFAFVRKYQGELGFIGRIEKPIDSIEFHDMPDWLNQHPQGLIIARYENEDLSAYDMVFSIPYRGRHLGVFKKSQNFTESGVNNE